MSYLVSTLCFLLPTYLLTYSLTYSLTHSLTHSLTPCSRVLLEKLIEKFPAFYGTRMFITAFTSAPTVPILSQIDPGQLCIYLINSRKQLTKGGPPVRGLMEVLTTARRINESCYESFKKASDLDCVTELMYFVSKCECQTTVAYYAFRWSSRVKMNVFQEDKIRSRILKRLTCLYLKYDE